MRSTQKDEPHKYYTLCGASLQGVVKNNRERTKYYESKYYRIIDGLFYGGISAFGRRVTPSEESRRVNHQIEQERRYFISKMSVDDCQRFEALDNLFLQANSFEERDTFGYGLRLGVALMCEVFLAENNSPIETAR